MEPSSSDEPVVVVRGHPLVRLLLQELDRLAAAVLVALVCHAAIEAANFFLGDPLGEHERWVAQSGNGNFRLRAAWFFALAGLWLHPAAPLLALLSARRSYRAERWRNRAAWGLASLLLAVALLRVLDLGVASATLGLHN